MGEDGGYDHGLRVLMGFFHLSFWEIYFTGMPWNEGYEVRGVMYRPERTNVPRTIK